MIEESIEHARWGGDRRIIINDDNIDEPSWYPKGFDVIFNDDYDAMGVEVFDSDLQV